MGINLYDISFLKKEYLDKLLQYGYETAEDFLSTCQVTDGLKSLANAMGCTENEVNVIKSQLIEIIGPESLPEPFNPPPMGAILKDNPKKKI
jgi:hypothetical protein